MQGAGLERVLPYLLLAPTLLLVLAVVVYPIGYGIRQSFLNFRFGHAIGSVGFDNYKQLFSDPTFGQALWVTLKFVVLGVTIETVLGLGLAMLVANEIPFARLAKLRSEERRVGKECRSRGS